MTSFTSSLAAALSERGTVRWISWLPPRRAQLELYDRGSWERAGLALRSCRAILLTLSHPALFVPYRSLVRAYRHLGARVVLVCHNVVAHEQVPGLQLLARKAFRLADALVVHSRSEARLARTLGGPDLPVFEGFHPVYPEHLARPWPRRPRTDRILAFGYVRPYKGIEDLVAVLPSLPGVSLDIVGCFREPSERYARLARRHGVQDRVRLVDGYVADERLHEVFGAADLVVAPYRRASQSGAVHLAYSFGRPVVATAVGGLTDAVVHGDTGYLVPPGDPLALAAGIRRALDAPADRFDDGIRRVVAARSWDRYAELVLDAASTDGRA